MNAHSHCTADTSPANLVSHVIAITSGKGGVGKSSISVNLGIALSRLGRKVCLLDADTGMANINILLGLTPASSLEHVLLAHKPVESVMLDAPYGLKVIPGASGIMECSDLKPRQQMHLTRELARIERDFDYLLIDTAAGISDTNLNFIQSAQQTIVVITGEPTSLTDAFSMIKVLRLRGKRKNYHVIVNMCTSTKQAREVFLRFAGAVEKYIGVKVDYLGYILQDESLRAAVTMQSPVTLFPQSDPSCRNFFRLSEALEARLSEMQALPSFSRHWYRLAKQQLLTKKTESPEHGSSAAADFCDTLVRKIEQGELSVADMEKIQAALHRALSVQTRTTEHLPNQTGSQSQGLTAGQSVSQAEQPRYDEVRFGSQQKLLQQLRANRDKPLIHFLK
tara:strand:- start:4598 stop:5779 length:1182 start_codon:yes stop_codon:yes gene_type:complete